MNQVEPVRTAGCLHAAREGQMARIETALTRLFDGQDGRPVQARPSPVHDGAAG